MKELKHFTRYLAVLGGIIWAVLVLTGCQSGPQFAEIGDLTSAGKTGTAASVDNSEVSIAPKPYTRPKQDNSDILFTGDSVTINFNSGDSQILPPHTESIKDDGRISPPYIDPIIASGKSPGELQDELQKLYKKLYVNMTVTVTSKDRYYAVDGEVKNPSPKPYLGKTDLVSAITSAGGFTEFAKKTTIQILRANGKKETVDYFKALEDTKHNVLIYPGDKIIVPRRFL